MEDESAENKPRHKNKIVQASLKNVQKQRQLVMELQEIDKHMEVELKIINREKLDAVRDYCRLEYDKRTVEYLQDDINGEALRRYIHYRRDKDGTQKGEKDNREKFDFKLLTSKIYVKLPPLEIPELLKENNPPVPPKKPRLYRSSSLIRQRSVSENSVLQPVQFSASLRNGTPLTPQVTSLPDINKFDKTNKKLFPKKSMPDIAEKSEIEPSNRIVNGQFPDLGERSRTFF